MTAEAPPPGGAPPGEGGRRRRRRRRRRGAGGAGAQPQGAAATPGAGGEEEDDDGDEEAPAAEARPAQAPKAPREPRPAQAARPQAPREPRAAQAPGPAGERRRERSRGRGRERDRERERERDRERDRERGQGARAPQPPRRDERRPPHGPRPSPSPAAAVAEVAPLLQRPPTDLDAGWGLPDEAGEPAPSAAPEPEVARTTTPPPPVEPLDPEGDDVFADLAEAPLPAGTLTNVCGIKFREAGTIHEYDAGDAAYVRGQRVVVESERGPVVATVAVGSRRVPALDPLRRVLRVATPADEKAKEKNAAKEREAYLLCKQRIRERKLPMKLVRVEYPLGQGKVLFYFAAEDRIDFRDLVKDLAAKLHTRVEMRQIGARDEAKMVGGIGACGRELCCATWLPAFVPISIKMAKDQGLPLNPSKVSGQCGRLKCCLVYEQDTYKEMRKTLPKVGKRVTTPAGPGKVVELDVLRQRVRVWFDEGGSQTFPADVVALKAAAPVDTAD